MKDIFRLDGKVAVVMGGAGGIGKALATGISRYGAKAVIASRNMEALKKAAEDIGKETGGEITPLTADVTDEGSMERLVQAVLKKHGTVDILVNAMGLNIKRDAFDYPMEDWDKIFNINVKGTMIACKHFGRVMKEKKQGKIINVSSVREVRGYTGGNAGYCATKGAVGMITKTLALEWAPYNIHVNAIGPSLIITPGTIHIQQNPELAEKYKAAVPLGKLGQPQDCVGATIFLASPASDFITGQTIFIDGGLTAS
ncbi:MAG: glucose 1-dehydrogenase [Deltaproteobacteria bacterium]|nr:glucose 1-dehydrogenase [Deltaproteobacteria bacterium]MBW2138524.1 glucose 1-dehydrogenase [Deltaproteobacteria bacterium]